MLICDTGVVHHLTTMGPGVELVERELLATGLTFTCTPTKIVWSGGREEGIEFVVYAVGPQSDAVGDRAVRLRSSGVWLQYRRVDASTPR